MRNSNRVLTLLSPEQRQGEILLHIKEKGTATIEEIAGRFAVSEMTVRRLGWCVKEKRSCSIPARPHVTSPGIWLHERAWWWSRLRLPSSRNWQEVPGFRCA